MTYNFSVVGMSCQSCVQKISEILKLNFADVKVSLHPPQIILTSSDTVTAHQINQLLKPLQKYSVNSLKDTASNDKAGFYQTYKPVILIFLYILLGVAIGEIASGEFRSSRAMGRFMGGFFLFFSFFKMLDVQKFADAYSTYDIIAKKIRGYGLIYPFVELVLGALYLAGIESVGLHLFTFFIMSVSIIGVVDTLVKKRTIQCACLGTIFNLPMSKVTFFEDGLMIVMSGLMILTMI